ncbi:FmdB family zinc ribbon protein [Thauera sp. 2A1]|uniref:FmdB family zinc ribbon protein n=1 Tax=Thauera sp. 2A1 TaxID=2570191 RepID=UPI001290E2AE|nr:zinc ribbon domain-containing protein [Thauera sp. 2A1]KAI5913578.1 zinc ribbon domain-containing protein [Thauera sp. 2A1]
MPIYEYRCDACGFQKEHMQKMSDAPLSTCPSCGKETYTKLLSAAGFQLKGSGWYATDFKGGSGAKASSTSESSAPAHSCGGGGCGCH